MLAPNSTLQNGRYRIVRCIGQGGMGAVYEAYDIRLNNQVAIKEALVYDPELLRAFEKEAQRLARLRHSALPNVIDHFTENSGGQYLVMEFIKGQDLRELQRERAQPFPVEQVVAWGKRLLDALDYLHQERVIHRDIKPANIKLTPKGELVLLDFGLAKGGLTHYTQGGMSLKGYTPGFAPPEQMTEKTTDERSDLYSLGATLYVLLTNTTPAHSFQRIYAEAQGQPDPLRPANELNPQVPPHITEMLTRTMALEPTQRPASAKQMLVLFSPTIPPSPTLPHTRVTHFPKLVNPSTLRQAQNSAGSPLRPQPTRLLWVLGPVAAVLLVLIVVGLAMTSDGERGERAVIATSEPLATEIAVALASPTATSEPSPIPTATSEPSPTRTATSEPTKTSTATATLEPSPTTKPAFHFLGGTPLPQSLSVISDKNISELREVARLGKGQITKVVYSPDGKWLAVGSSIGIGIDLYDAETLEVIRFLDSQEQIHMIIFSPDGTLLAVNGPQNSVQLWRVSDGQLLTTFEGNTSSMTSVSFSPDGKRLASGGCHEVVDYSCVVGEVRLWEVSDGQLLATLEGHTDNVRRVSFSADGEQLASASEDQTMRLWQVSDGQLLATLALEGHTGYIENMKFSPDGERFVSISSTGEYIVQIWQVSDGQLLSTLDVDGGGTNVLSFSPDGEQLAIGSYRGVQLWRVSDEQLLMTFDTYTASVDSISFSPDGQRLVGVTAWDNTIELWRVSDGQRFAILQGDTANEVWSVSFSPDGKLLASSSDNSTVELWQVSDGQLLNTLEGHRSSINSFSPDGQLLASGSLEGVQLWRVRDQRLLVIFGDDYNTTYDLNFSPDGEMLASASYERVHLWRVSDGKLLNTLEVDRSSINSVSFSPDGELLVSGSCSELENRNCVTGDVRLWRVSDGQLLNTLEGHTDHVQSVSFSPDGERVASGSWDDTVRLWRASDGQLLATLEGHTENVWSVHFSPDGKWLASASEDGTVRLWRVSDGQLLATLERHTSRVLSVSFSPDGRLLASGSSDGTIRLWGVVE